MPILELFGKTNSIMKKISTRFKNLYIFKNKRFDDNRGYLREIFLEKKIKKKLKFTIVSSSKKNVIRGMHFQVISPQDKLISVVKGKILDVVVDLRKKSKTFGKDGRLSLISESILLFDPVITIEGPSELIKVNNSSLKNWLYILYLY